MKRESGFVIGVLLLVGVVQAQEQKSAEVSPVGVVSVSSVVKEKGKEAVGAGELNSSTLVGVKQHILKEVQIKRQPSPGVDWSKCRVYAVPDGTYFVSKGSLVIPVDSKCPSIQPTAIGKLLDSDKIILGTIVCTLNAQGNCQKREFIDAYKPVNDGPRNP